MLEISGSEMEKSSRSALDRYRLKNVLEKLASIRGQGTELISLYIPPDRNLADVMNHLRDEYAQASNIKSKRTRTHVQDALAAIMQRLKLYRTVPENGLAIFAGVIPYGPTNEKLEVFIIEPPDPVPYYYYRCDSQFHLDPLWEMTKERETVGLVTIDLKEATIAVLKGKRYEILKRLTSGVWGKHRAGGQSARRFERLREQAIHEFFKRVGERISEIFLNMDNLKGIIIGGPGYTKHDFLEGDYLHHEIKKKILAVLDTGYADEDGIRELVFKASQVLQDLEISREKNLVQRFMRELSRDSGLAVYGLREVLRALESGLVDTLLVSEELGLDEIVLKCDRCGHTIRKIVRKDDESWRKLIGETCEKCGNGKYNLESQRDLVEVLSEIAETMGTKLELISTETEEGMQLKRVFGGIAAILRYRIDARG